MYTHVRKHRLGAVRVCEAEVAKLYITMYLYFIRSTIIFYYIFRWHHIDNIRLFLENSPNSAPCRSRLGKCVDAVTCRNHRPHKHINI